MSDYKGFEYNGPHARKTDPDTSHEAPNPKRNPRLRYIILSVFRPGIRLTAEAACKLAGLSVQTTHERVSDLNKMGLIAWIPKLDKFGQRMYKANGELIYLRGPTDAGRTGRLHEITPAGIAKLLEEEETQIISQLLT